MPVQDITPKAVATVLRAVRRAGATPMSPLLGLDVVTDSLQRSGLADSPDARFIALSDLLAETAWTALERMRGSAPSDRSRRTQADEAADLKRDFASESEDREAWSAIYWQYFGAQAELVATLSRLGIPYYTFRRRRLRGLELLAARLRALEIAAARPAAGATGPAAGIAVPAPPMEPAPYAPAEPTQVPATRSARLWATAIVGVALVAAVAATPAAWLAGLATFGAAVGPTGPTAVPAATTGLRVVGPMELEPRHPRAGETVTARFVVRNDTPQPRTVARLKAGARGPHACSRNWNAPHVDFPTVVDVRLAPGAAYAYEATRTFTTPGDYFVEPVQLGAHGRWGGIGPSPRAWFDVADRGTGAVVRPDCLVVIEPLTVVPSEIRVGDAFTVSARIKNGSNDVIDLAMIVAAVREPGARQGAWGYPAVFAPSLRDVTLAPDGEIGYEGRRTAGTAGVFELEMVVQQDGKWSGVWPFATTQLTVRPP